MKLGFAVIGLGAISTVHLDAITSIPEARLVAVADLMEERAASIGQSYGCHAYSDYRHVLEREDVDVVSILTPSGGRRNIALDAAAAGKHIITEKPLEITIERIDEMMAACDKAGVLLSGIFQFRFKPAWQLLKKFVSQGRLGKLYVGDAYNKWHRTREYYKSAGWRGTWEFDGGGALMNQGIHVVDLLQWILGDVQEVTAYCKTLHHDIEVEDTVVAILNYVSGAVGVIEATTSVSPGYPMTMQIHGEHGSIHMQGDWITEWAVDDISQQEYAEIQPLMMQNATQSTSSDPAQVDCTWHRLQINDIVHAILENREPLIPGREARKSVEIIQCIYQSAREGRPIRLR